MLLRPLRTALLLTAAFATGVIYERLQHRDRCDEAGGTVQLGLCQGETG